MVQEFQRRKAKEKKKRRETEKTVGAANQTWRSESQSHLRKGNKSGSPRTSICQRPVRRDESQGTQLNTQIGFGKYPPPLCTYELTYLTQLFECLLASYSQPLPSKIKKIKKKEEKEMLFLPLCSALGIKLSCQVFCLSTVF